MDLLDNDVHIPNRPMLQMRPLLPHHVVIVAVRDAERVGEVHGGDVPRDVADLGVAVVQVVAALCRAVDAARGDVDVLPRVGGHVVDGRGGDYDVLELRVVEVAPGEGN